jgi:hypothetical protein
MASPEQTINAKDLLNWYFTVGAVVFGVFGFLYSVYATAMFQASPEHPDPPPITVFLRRFCRVAAAVLVVLTAMPAWVAFQARAGWETWVLIVAFGALAASSVWLAMVRME